MLGDLENYKFVRWLMKMGGFCRFAIVKKNISDYAMFFQEIQTSTFSSVSFFIAL